MPDQRAAFERAGAAIALSYRALRDGRFRFGDGRHARVHVWEPGAIDAEIEGRRIRARVTRWGDRLALAVPGGDVELAIVPRFTVPGSEDAAGGFTARMPGKVIDLRVAVGDRVVAGETLVVLEAMKMEHPMRATEDGVVREVRVAVGDQVESGALLLVVEQAPQVSRSEAKPSEDPRTGRAQRAEGERRSDGEEKRNG
jgi:propionyl-CoA carboxylase alpha chain